MKKNLVMTVAIIGIILPVISISLSPAAAQTDSQAGPFVMSPVVTRGDPTLNGGTFFNCDSCNSMIAGEHGLNDLGQVVIFSLSGVGLTGPCQGVFVVSNRTGYVVADVCHETSFGRFALYAGANINNRGQVALNMGPAVNNIIIDMILLYSDGQLLKIAAEGDLSPAGTVLGGNCGLGRPSINTNGEVAFFACSNPDSQGRIFNGIFASSGGTLRTVVKSGDPSPLGGQISLAFGPAEPVQINDDDDVLFGAGQFDPDSNDPERFGLYLATSNGMEKIELGRDTMPNSSKAADNSLGGGHLNNKGDVLFGVRLAGKPKVGYFLYSGAQKSTIIVDRQTTPIGGTYNLTQEVEDPYGARINDNGTVAFMANVTDGSSSEAIFLASPKAVLKVVGIGDRLPTGEKIRSINSFALNNLGQVAFFANGSANAFYTMPLGVFLATPVAPTITAIKLKHKKSGLLMLCVDGNGLITNDTVIEVNGLPLGELSYPTEFQENGGTTTRVMSRDSQIEQMMQSGQPLQVTVFNSLTNLRSASVTLAE